MGIKDQMMNVTHKTQEGIKMTTKTLTLLAIRGLSGFFLGLTLALIGQELTQFGSFSLIFMTIVIMAIFMKLSQGWSFTKIFIFDLICLLVMQVLKMYILIAP
ncbi:MAG: hypothetical protein L6Q37_08880 [Bdellovibrionaceae bacterium]|nr:hypothetical protein [Pseudobdellovibrionaceae bacterium]NUM57516.1 hypothetical protein [Pseudobdellovibrionaceae bacterium]